MKHQIKQNKSQSWLASGLTVLALIGSTLVGRAAPYIINQFDTAAEVGGYSDAGWDGNITCNFTWSTTNDITVEPGAPNNAGSGSMQWQFPWPQPESDGDQDVSGRQYAFSINPAGYDDFSFDFMILPDCATDAGATTYGTLEPTFCGSQTWYQYTFASLALPTSSYIPGKWYHADFPLSNPTGGDTITGWGIKMEQAKQHIVGTTDFLIDNIILEPAIAPAPPRLSVAPVTTPPGLAMVLPGTANSGGQDGMLLEATSAAAGPNFTWVGAQQNVTYSMNITSFPNAAHTGCQAVIYLIPNGGAGDVVINYVDSTVAQLVVANNADGSATATFSYKTNSSGTAPNLGNVTLNSPSGAVGTWSLVFNDTASSDTAFTINGPGGVSTTGSLPSENWVQTFFENPVSAYFGAFNQNGTNNAGQVVSFSELHIDGTQYAQYGAGPIDDVVTNDGGVVNTADWTLCYRYQAESANTLVIPSTAKEWVSWTMPNTNDLWTTPALGSGASWTDTELSGATPATPPVFLGNSEEALFSPSSFSQTTSGYFFIAPATWTH